MTAPTATPTRAARRGSADLLMQIAVWGWAVDAAGDPAAVCAEARPDQQVPPHPTWDATADELTHTRLFDGRTEHPAPAWFALPAVVEAVAAGHLPHPGLPGGAASDA